MHKQLFSLPEMVFHSHLHYLKWFDCKKVPRSF